MTLTEEQLNTMAAAVWPELQKWSEASYVHDNDSDTYKPSYRVSTMFVHDMFGPVQLRAIGLRRHLTNAEYIEVLKRSHPYFAEALAREGEEESFLVLFEDHRELYEPEDWGRD